MYVFGVLVLDGGSLEVASSAHLLLTVCGAPTTHSSVWLTCCFDTLPDCTAYESCSEGLHRDHPHCRPRLGAWGLLFSQRIPGSCYRL